MASSVAQSLGRAFAGHDAVPPAILRRAGGLGEPAFIGLLALYLVSYHTLLTEYVPISNYVIKMLVPLALLFGYRRLPLRGLALTIVVLYHLFFAVFLVASLANRPETWVVIDFFKHYMRMAILPVLLFVLPANDFSDRVIRFPLFVGVVCALQSMLLWVLLYLGMAPAPSPLAFERFRDDWPAVSYGIFGYGFQLRSFGDTVNLRAQSFFIEPSKFAMFLEYCIFVAYGYWRMERTRLYLWAFVICLAAFLLAQSVAAHVALLGAVAFVALRKPTDPFPPPIRLLFATASIALLGYMAVHFLQYITELYTQSNIRGEIVGMTLGKSPRGVIQRRELVLYYWDLIVAHPFGEGAAVKHEHGFAPIYWIRRAGFIGFAFIAAIQILVYLKAIDPWLGTGQRTIVRYLGLAFIAQSIHHLSYGDWMDAHYLFIMALLLTLTAFAEEADPRQGAPATAAGGTS